MDPPSLMLPEMWQFPAPPRIASVTGESTVTEQSGGGRGKKKRKDAAAAAAVEDEEEDEKLASTSSGNELTDCEAKRLKVNGDLKAEAETSSGVCNKPTQQNAQPPEAPKQDYIHVRARRGQATDSHSLAERARREKISERMKILQDLVPGCNKVIGKASVLDEIINYIQALQRQVEFLSMKLEAVNSRMSVGIEGLPPKDFMTQAYENSPNLAFSSQPAPGYRQGPTPEWLHMQVGGAYERVT